MAVERTRSQWRDYLNRAIEKRRLWQMAEQTDLFRLVNSEADGCAGITVDWVKDVLLLEQHRKGVSVAPVIDALVDLFPHRSLYLKERWSPRRELRRGRYIVTADRDDTQDTQTPPPSASFAAFFVREAGLSYEIDLSGDEHIGLFVDARPIRRAVRERSADRRVLNLFSYTCSLGVCAAAGGAVSTVNIDNKASALSAGRRNFDVNHLDVDSRTFFKCDVLYYLKRAAAKRGRFDLIILDPPPRFTYGKRSVFQTQRDYPRLLNLAMGVAADGAYLLVGMNALKGTTSQLAAMIEQTTHAERGLEILDFIGAGRDCPPSPDRPLARFFVTRIRRIDNLCSDSSSTVT